MKIAKAAGYISVAALIGVAGLIYARSPVDDVPVQTVEIASSALAGALIDVQLPAAFSAKAVAGERQYEDFCASCHGLNAAGNEGIAPPLIHETYQPARHGDADFAVAMRDGTRQHHWSFGPMRPLDRKLTDGEMDAIIRYIRELQRENGIM